MTQLDLELTPQILALIGAFGVSSTLQHLEGTYSHADGRRSSSVTTDVTVVATPITVMAKCDTFQVWEVGNALAYLRGDVVPAPAIGHRIVQRDQTWSVLEVKTYVTGELVAAHAVRLGR